eukprot:SAG31_NODE_17_length_35773_cov_25.999271_35_plen_291_part_00
MSGRRSALPALLLLALLSPASRADCVPPHPCPPPPPPCSCADQNHCRALQSAPPQHEVFTFSLAGPGQNLTSQFYRYDWGLVTTAAWMTAGNESTCWAHAHGARITTSSNWGLYSAANSSAQWDYFNLLTTPTYRSAWVKSMLDRCEALGADGVNCARTAAMLMLLLRGLQTALLFAVDIEGAEAVLLDGHYETYTFSIGGGKTQIINTTKTADGLTALLTELKREGRKRIAPHFQLSFCYPVYPAQPQLAVAYDIAAISRVVDFFVPMGYDMNGMGAMSRTQIWDTKSL